MIRWKLTIEYDGSDFLGWQRQKNGRTVQGELEKALQLFLSRPVELMGQGRTDKGVHAEGQVAHVDFPEELEKEQLLGAMRGLLPFDLAMTNAEIVDDDFHARFDAKSRIYRYQVSQKPVPLHRHICLIHLKPLNRELLNDCARLLIGEHNFRNFAKESADEKNRYKTTVCTIRKSLWLTDRNLLVYSIESNRFLRHMVRRLVGTMIKVASGKFEMEEFQTMLAGRTVQRKGHAAPAKGLILERVVY